MDFAWLCLLAAGGAAIGIALKVPSGALVGAMVAVGAGNLVTGRAADLPDPLFTLGLVLVGANIGGRVTRETVNALRGALVPALGVVFLLVAVCLLVAYLLAHLAGMNLRDALFATSPGAMSAVVGMSASAGADAALVASFHVLRIALVTASLPVLLRLAK